MKTVTTTGYCLRNKLTGLLACLLMEVNDSNGYSNEHQYRLVEGDETDDFPEFEVSTADKAALALVIDTDWYNSTATRPGWGTLDMTQYEVVEVTRVSSVDVKASDVPVPVKFGRPLEERKTMRRLAERYLGHSIPDTVLEGAISFVVIPAPAGETLESLKQKSTNRPVLLDSSGGYPDLCLGVFALPEEYADLVKSGLGVGLILTTFQFND